MSILTNISLSPREEVVDTFFRCLQGLNSNNRNLFKSTILKTKEFHFISNMFIIKGCNAARFNIIFLITTHISSNVRVELKGTDTASLSCHSISYHVRPEDQFKAEESSFTAYNLYDIDFVKADGLWKIKTWNVDIRRTTGDPSLIQA
ncbi:hypothetical protein DM02DRAFT_528828 [Periconia macrospinosa]|uniref:SnoaL-like domain-containing protein n=1 Tax=Periconia macrospinosa TaxID=97972 RepID=A0A2V1DNA7_9PLEO|nr:hypothetical protein DM02DRAFT_528828 [Periconia macrospinosa]